MVSTGEVEPTPAASAVVEIGSDAELSELGGAVVPITVVCPTGLPDPRLTVEVTQHNGNGTAMANGLTDDLVCDGNRHTVPVWVLGFEGALGSGEAQVVARLIVGTSSDGSATA